MNAVDTNVLLYAHDPRAERKREIASGLVRSLEDGVLLWQVACEYVAASRKLAGLGFNADVAWQDVHDLRRYWRTALPNWYSEDFSHLARLETLEVINPFVKA